jgi:orotidine-5'-phosphate decarboxylase
MMFVIGATQTPYFTRIRQIIPHHFLLIPGVGAQGGSLGDVCNGLMNDDIGILVNSSREIIYASKNVDFDIKAGEKARELATEMSLYL